MPPWLQALLEQSTQRNAGPYATAGTPAPLGTPAVAPPSAQPDFLTAFANALGQKVSGDAALAPRRQTFLEDATFGRHLDMSGNPIDPATGSAPGSNATWNRFFGGNAVSDTAKMERTSPLATNYGPVGPGMQTTQTLPAMTDAQMRGAELVFAPRVADPNYRFGLPVPPKHQRPYRSPKAF